MQIYVILGLLCGSRTYNTDGNVVKDFTDLTLQIWELNKRTGNFYSDPTSVF